MSSHSLSRMSLDKAFMAFTLLGAAVFFGVTLFFTNSRVGHMQDELLRSVIALRGEHLALDVADHLDGHWRDLEGLSTALPFSDRAGFRAFLTREVGDASHLTWAAFVDMDGQVQIASRMQREGERVASEEWFLAAQRAPGVAFATQPSGEQVMAMTIPVRASHDIQAGYLTFHFRPDWFEAMLKRIAASMRIDLLIFDPNGKAVLRSFAVDDADLEKISVRNALAGQQTTLLETWTGLGERYAVSVPTVPVTALPPLGWRIVVLTAPNQFNSATSELRFSLLEILGGVAVILFLMSIGFIWLFLTPLHRLVENAHQIADGADDVVPVEDHRTAELSLLSSAIARMQGRMLRAEDRLAELQASTRQDASSDVTR